MPDARTVLYLCQDDTAALLDWPDVIACLAEAYVRETDPSAAPPKAVARRDEMWLRALPAISADGSLMGAKIIAKGWPRPTDHLTALWSTESAELACLIEAKTVTAMRTAGTSALAIDRIARTGPLRVAVLGSGREAATHVSATAAVREIEALTVYSPTAANRQALAERFGGELGIDCRAADTPRDAVDGADLVLAAARSHDETPILEGAWLEPGMLVVSIGSTVPEQREVDPDVIRRAAAIVVDVPDEVTDQTGDMIAARAAGVDFDDRIVPLADVASGRRIVHQLPDRIVMFKSVGSGLQDIAVSQMCYTKALAAGVGITLLVGHKGS